MTHTITISENEIKIMIIASLQNKGFKWVDFKNMKFIDLDDSERKITIQCEIIQVEKDND